MKQCFPLHWLPSYSSSLLPGAIQSRHLGCRSGCDLGHCSQLPLLPAAMGRIHCVGLPLFISSFYSNQRYFFFLPQNLFCPGLSGHFKHIRPQVTLSCGRSLYMFTDGQSSPFCPFSFHVTQLRDCQALDTDTFCYYSCHQSDCDYGDSDRHYNRCYYNSCRYYTVAVLLILLFPPPLFIICKIQSKC